MSDLKLVRERVERDQRTADLLNKVGARLADCVQALLAAQIALQQLAQRLERDD